MSDFLNFTLLQLGTWEFKVVNIFYILAIVAGVRLLVWAFSYTVRRRLIRRRNIEPGRHFAVVTIFKYLVYSIAGMLLLSSLGVNITVLIASSTALFVGIGFGLQHTFNDLIGGIVILVEGSVELTDIVEVDDLIGKVTKISLRTTEIETIDGVSIIVPNSKFLTQNVVNLSHGRRDVRFHVKVGVAYGSDPALVRKILLNCAKSHGDIEKNPAPVVYFANFGESSLQFELHFWTYRSFYVPRIKSDLRFIIENALRENGIRIPFPQRDVHIRTETSNRVPHSDAPPPSQTDNE